MLGPCPTVAGEGGDPGLAFDLATVAAIAASAAVAAVIVAVIVAGVALAAFAASRWQNNCGERGWHFS